MSAPVETGSSPPPERAPPGFGRLGLVLVVAILGGAALAVLLFVRERSQLRREADRRAHDVAQGPRVFVAPVRVLPGAREVTLPADVRAFRQATVYAKVAGYVRSIRVDRGDLVRRNQILGVLESPEVDQQVAAARSTADTNRRTYERFGRLVSRDYVSRQDFDAARGQHDVAQASLLQARALQRYKILRAPFDGTITARYVDPGALIPAATGATASALPLVDIADLRRLRITVFVQQDAAPFVHVGDAVTIVADQRPQAPIAATVSRLSKALDQRSRAMLCEIWLDNRYQLYPGTFVRVTLHLQAPSLPAVPSTALLWRNDETVVAVVRDGRVAFAPVKPGLDDGKTVQLVSGVQPGELVALDLPTEIAEGMVVRASPAPAPAPPAPAAAAGAAAPPAGASPPAGGEAPARGAVQGQRGRPPRR
jgi:RND family efflux transporter MFP subunit